MSSAVWRFGSVVQERKLDTYNALAAIFVDAGCKKLRKALIEAENEQAEKNVEKK